MRKYYIILCVVILVLALAGPSMIFRRAENMPILLKYYFLFIDLSAIWLSLKTIFAEIRNKRN